MESDSSVRRGLDIRDTGAGHSGDKRKVVFMYVCQTAKALPTMEGASERGTGCLYLDQYYFITILLLSALQTARPRAHCLAVSGG